MMTKGYGQNCRESDSTNTAHYARALSVATRKNIPCVLFPMQALIKAAKRAAKGATPGGGSAWGQSAAPLPSWAPSLVQEGWAGTVAAINSWGKQHVGWALCIDQNISKVRSGLNCLLSSHESTCNGNIETAPYSSSTYNGGRFVLPRTRLLLLLQCTLQQYNVSHCCLHLLLL